MGTLRPCKPARLIKLPDSEAWVLSIFLQGRESVKEEPTFESELEA